MADEEFEQAKGLVDTKEATPTAWDRFRGFVRANKTKIIAGFAALVGWIAGDSGVWDAIRTAIFGA